jgi:hypothetical protein
MVDRRSPQVVLTAVAMVAAAVLPLAGATGATLADAGPDTTTTTTFMPDDIDWP